MAVIYIFNNCDLNIYFLRDTSAAFFSKDSKEPFKDPAQP